MKNIFFIILTFCLFSSQLLATHNRAGEITLKQLDDYTYEITVTTFTYTLSQADRSALEVQWGDNTVSSATRVSITRLPNFYQKNVYVTRHTFPGAGTYEIVVQDPNRNLGVKNIPNSVNVVFSIKTTISINPSIGLNSTPVLLSDPIDKAALNQLFIHNPSAYDPDGDSISYKLTVCTEEDGKPIEDYEYPSHSDTLYIDAVTGDLVWKNPDEIGIYNIAIDIEEWREGVKIGNIVRDMQIEVAETTNNKPEIDSLINYCVEAGTIIAFNVSANDIDNDFINLEATGGPLILEDNPAQFELLSSTSEGYREGTFLWETSCSHVREQQYTIVFKAEDDNADTKLIDLKNVNIKVIGAAPEPPELLPSSNSITLLWDPDSCTNVTGYRLYRKTGPSGYTPDSCVSGVPSHTGYSLIATINGRNETVFTDDGRGSGLEQGAEYCYMITSIYPDGSQSFPSEERCTQLIAGMPAFLQVSVTNSSQNGEIDVRWAKPTGLDTIPATGPFEYVITRRAGIFGNTREQVFTKIANDINDTIFIDQNVNTLDSPIGYNYDIALYYNNQPLSNLNQIEVASSFYPELVGGDNQITINMRKNVPWINYDYTIYRQNKTTGVFDSIGFSPNPTFIDKGLKNEVEYCYQVKSTGWRSIEGTLYENVNYSHVTCAQPIDTTPPCTPVLSGQSFCNEFYNQLNWSFNSDTCLEDVTGYKLYYYQTSDPQESPADSVIFEDKNTLSYQDLRPDETLTGCYTIVAVDSFQNVSNHSVKLCLDECSNYVLPNVFSPNDDHINNLYMPHRTAYVEKVDFQVFNRWGMLVFQTEEPDIYWDGKIMGTNKLVSPGVYYYICEVFEPRLGGIESYTLTGFIYVFSGSENNVIIE